MVSCCWEKKVLSQQRAAWVSRPVLRKFESGLRRLYILGLPPLGALYYVELHLLAFLQAAEPTRLNRREVYKHVLSALAADEPITLGIVKPLDCSCFHGVARFLFLRYALCQSQNFFRQVTLVSRELLKNCKGQTQQDCNSDVPEIAKLFHSRKVKYIRINALR